jgi:hypothetical protein
MSGLPYATRTSPSRESPSRARIASPAFFAAAELRDHVEAEQLVARLVGEDARLAARAGGAGTHGGTGARATRRRVVLDLGTLCACGLGERDGRRRAVALEVQAHRRAGRDRVVLGDERPGGGAAPAVHGTDDVVRAQVHARARAARRREAHDRAALVVGRVGDHGRQVAEQRDLACARRGVAPHLHDRAVRPTPRRRDGPREHLAHLLAKRAYVEPHQLVAVVGHDDVQLGGGAGEVARELGARRVELGARRVEQRLIGRVQIVAGRLHRDPAGRLLGGGRHGEGGERGERGEGGEAGGSHGTAGGRRGSGARPQEGHA